MSTREDNGPRQSQQELMLCNALSGLLLISKQPSKLMISSEDKKAQSIPSDFKELYGCQEIYSPMQRYNYRRYSYIKYFN